MSRTRVGLILITGLLIGAILAPIGASSAEPATDSASGIATIKAGKRCKTVRPGMNVTSATKVTATMLTSVSGNSVRNVRRLTDVGFKVCLTNTASRRIRVAWIAHNGSGVADVSHVHRAADLVDEPGVAYNYDKAGAIVAETDLFVREIASTEIRVPADGYVAIEVTGNWRGGSLGHDEAACQLQKGTAAGFSVSGDEPWFWLAEGVNGQARLTSFSAHRVMQIFAADNPSGVLAGQNIMLVCDGEDGSIQATQLHISATYYPTKYDGTLTPIPGPILP